MSLPTEREYILYCDESVTDGKYYSNFYGGLLIGASHMEAVTRRIEEVKRERNLLAKPSGRR